MFTLHFCKLCIKIEKYVLQVKIGGNSSAAKKAAKGGKSGEDRAARATRRSLAKEAPDVKEPLSKRARLDSSSDLVNLLSTSAPVRHILAASGSRHMPKEAEGIKCQELSSFQNLLIEFVNFNILQDILNQKKYA